MISTWILSVVSIIQCTALHCTALHCTVQYNTVLCRHVLYCTVLYCTALYCCFARTCIHRYPHDIHSYLISLIIVIPTTHSFRFDCPTRVDPISGRVLRPVLLQQWSRDFPCFNGYVVKAARRPYGFQVIISIILPFHFTSRMLLIDCLSLKHWLEIDISK